MHGRRALAVILTLASPLLAGCLDDPGTRGHTCPADPTAQAQPDGHTALSWEPVPDAEAYPIVRSGPDAEAILVANVSAPNTTFTDTTAAAGTSYTYTIHSWNGSARSTACPTTEITSVPFLPTVAGLVAAGALAPLVYLGLRRRS